MNEPAQEVVASPPSSAASSASGSPRDELILYEPQSSTPIDACQHDGEHRSDDVDTAAVHELSATERSNWGLFHRTVSVVREGSNAYKSLVYQCTPNQTVEFRQPLEGAGTTLMHGDFARKLSPSEEALAIYIIKHPRLFEGKRVMDVGAGLGFAGLVCATCTNPSCLELSDGDPEVVSTLRSSVELNLSSFGSTRVDVRKVLWDRSEEWSERGSFDLVIAADVVYLDFLHAPLLGMVARVLRPGGTFLLFASRRNGSLEKFINNAKAFFPSVEACTDYDSDVAKAIGKHAKCFPVMVRLVAADVVEELPASVAQLCEELREKRALQEKQAKLAERLRKKEMARHRARSQSLIEHRKKRLEALEVEEEERLAAEAAAAAATVTPAVAKQRVPTVSQAEQEGRSDWGLFPRQCIQSCDGSYKDMIYEIGGQQITIRRPLSNGGFACSEARKVSPSEEVLALWASKRRRLLKRKRVLELGSGCGLAGFSIATCIAAKHVEITDGDPNVLAMLEGSKMLNCDAFTAKKVCTSQLVWGEVPDGLKPFDFILAADILDGDFSVLLKTLRRLLKPTGTIIIFSSQHNTDTFLSAAKPVFDRIEVTRHYDEEVTRALQGMARFPKMLRLQRSDAFVPRSSSASVVCAQEHDPAPVSIPLGQPLAEVEIETSAEQVCAEKKHGSGDKAEVVRSRSVRRRNILAARAQQRISRTRTIDSAEAAEDGGCATEGEEENELAAVAEAQLATSSKDQGLPSLGGSRSSSAKSIRLASEMSPLALGTVRNQVDASISALGMVTASAMLASRSTEMPNVADGGIGNVSKLGLPSAPVSSNLWARPPIGRVGSTASATGAQGPGTVSKGSCSNSNGTLQGHRSSSVPPAIKGKPLDSLLGLAIDGSAMAIQRCSGAVVRGKQLRSGREVLPEQSRVFLCA